MKAILFLLSVFSAPLSTVIFRKEDHKDIAEIPFEKTLIIKSYEIMSGALDARPDEFITVALDTEQKGAQSGIMVPLEKIKKPYVNRLFCIKVNLVEGEPEKEYYSETFRFDDRDSTWVLARAYEKDPWYIENKYYIIGGSSIFVVLIIGYIISRSRRQTYNEGL